MSSNSDCDNGDKFVIKNTAGVNRRQFLFIEGKTILAFVPKGKKFTECSVYTEVTTQVDCKVRRIDTKYCFFTNKTQGCYWSCQYNITNLWIIITYTYSSNYTCSSNYSCSSTYTRWVITLICDVCYSFITMNYIYYCSNVLFCSI